MTQPTCSAEQSSMAELTFSTPDGRFVLRVGRRQLRTLERLRSRAGACETGGILIGRYDTLHRTATVERVSGPPADSRAGRLWFYRGVEGLQTLLDRLWRSDESHYLGEWHHHPASDTTPSGQDLRQLRAIASDPSYCCPEPILLIVGTGDPIESSLRVLVVLSKGAPLALTRVPVQAGCSEPCV